MELIHDEAREKDVQAMAEHIYSSSIEDTGDYGGGGRCPYCYTDCGWNESMSDIEHKQNCIYLIAKDLLTNAPTSDMADEKV